jgi:hypothetical protein
MPHDIGDIFKHVAEVLLKHKQVRLVKEEANLLLARDQAANIVLETLCIHILNA